MPVSFKELINFSLPAVEGLNNSPAVKRRERDEVEDAEREGKKKQIVSQIIQKEIKRSDLRIHKGDNEHEQRIKEECRDVVHHHTRDRRQKKSPLPMIKIIRIDRNGLCPAESRKGEHNETENIKMCDRIEREPSVCTRRGIAAPHGNECVRKFVKRKNDCYGEKTRNEIDDVFHKRPCKNYTIFERKMQGS